MANPIILNSPSITVNAIDISDNCDSVEIMGGDGTVTATAFGDTYVQRRRRLIRNWGTKLNYFIDHTTTEAYHTFKGAWESTVSTGLAVLIRPTTGARSVTNPEYSGLVAIDGDFALLAGQLGEAGKGSINLVGMGNLSIITTSS